MKKSFLLFVLCLVGCSDSVESKGFNIKVYSGEVLIKTFDNVNFVYKISDTAWYFTDSKTNRNVRISGGLTIIEEN